MATIHGIGEPVNDGERKVIKHLGDNLPKNYSIYHNFELNDKGKVHEFDILVIGEYAIYVVEVKDYHGYIKGDIDRWSFESEATVNSPIKQVVTLTKIILSYLKKNNIMYTTITELIIIPDDKTTIEIKGPRRNKVLKLNEAVAYMMSQDKLSSDFPNQITPRIKQTIEKIIGKLKPSHHRHKIGNYYDLEEKEKSDQGLDITTYWAKHSFIKTTERFILKVYQLDVYADRVEREKAQNWILREAQALHLLGYHKNIAQADIPFTYESDKIVLPLHWIEGISLRDWLNEGKKFEPDEAIDLICQVGQALEYAREHGVLHRDMRPENIIIAEPDKRPVLVNFAFARIENNDFPSVGSHLHGRLSEKYTAPEVLENPKDLSPASDQYALGIIAFELLTGQQPYQRIKEIYTSEGLPHPPSEIKADLSKDLDYIIIKMCAFNPKERFDTLADALEYLKGFKG